MAAAQTTALNQLVGGTPTASGTLAITTSEQEWAFTTAARTVVLQLTSDQNWLYASQTSGPYTRIVAGTGFSLPISTAGQSAFVKAETTSGTLYSSTVG